MDAQVEKFQQLLKPAEKILITSHISPDPDAVCATLVIGTTLKLNFPDKKVFMVLEEKPGRDLSFLSGFEDISFGNVLDATREYNPDLFIILDAMNFQRVSRSDNEQLEALVKDELKAKVAIIDHHTKLGLIDSSIYINSGLPATAQEAYRILFKELSMRKPEGFAQTTLLGIVSDTSRFKYINPKHRETFEAVSELLDAGASIEAQEYQLERYSKQQMDVFSILAKNSIDSREGYTYSYINGSEIESANGEAVKTACEIFTDQFIRNIENNYWGFIVYPEVVNGKESYSVSLRSVGDAKDVSEIAGRLGGGGHVAAAGAKGIKAKNASEAIEKVIQAIKNSN